MIRTRLGAPRAWHTIRRSALLVVSVAVSHQLTYALGADGHVGPDRSHGYWPLMLLVAGVAAAALTARTVIKTARAATGA